MSVQAEIPLTHPMRQAWEKYKATPEYANTRAWALKEAHVDGSLWAAFVAGYTGSAAHGGEDAPYIEAVDTPYGLGYVTSLSPEKMPLGRYALQAPAGGRHG